MRESLSSENRELGSGMAVEAGVSGSCYRNHLYLTEALPIFG
jgi:hypothetical protein